MINSILFKDKNYRIINYEEKDEKIYFNVKSNITTCKCPFCHKESSTYHGTYIRHIQDTPIHNTETWLNVSTYEFICENKECNATTFTEKLSFARKNKVKTDSLIQLILSISIFLSSTSASLILSFIGVKVSADTIDDIVKNIKIENTPNVEEIGIDDVAIKKGQTYATAIYDMKDHHLLALLNGRDANCVKEWLSKHNKIKIVARDRASSYAVAISEVLPNCIQVADRFHLFENLIKYLKDIFYNEMPERIFIQDDKIVDEKEIQKVPIELNINKEILEKFDYDNSPPVNEKGNIIYFDNKKHDLNSKQYKMQTEQRKKKCEMIKRLRECLKDSNCHETKKIAKEFKISEASLRKYKSLTDEEVENIVIRKDYKKRKTVMDNYINIIYKMIVNNVSPEYIIAYLFKKEYPGKISSIKNYIVNITNNNNLNYNYLSLIFMKYKYPDNVTVITRYELLKYILTIDNKKKKDNIEKYINLIIEQYPIVEQVKEIFTNFHDTIFGKDTAKLDNFIEKYKNKIPSFCNGLKKDIAPVKNAISYQINSGFVEGNNNKFKLIKRIVYGKQKLCNLFKKSYLCFLATTDNFDIEEIVESILQNDKK